MLKRIFVFFILSLFTLHAHAQEPVRPRPSPLAIASMRYKDGYIKIVYSQPHRRGRSVFGELVPLSKVWRFGANEATELTTTRDILINKTLLKAGTYSVFCIPESDKWTIILNSELGLWGSYNYNQRLDVIRFEIPVRMLTTPFEAFTIAFEQRNNQADMVVSWDNVQVLIPIQFLEPKS